MKKYLACVLLAIALTLNADAAGVNQGNGSNGSNGSNGNGSNGNNPPVSVPDNGSTVVLLGLGVTAIALMNRKKAMA